MVLPETGLAGTDDGLGAIRYLQLAYDVRDMVAYRLGAKVETPGDLGIFVALSYEVEDLALAVAELWEHLGRRCRMYFGEEVREPGGYSRAEDGLAVAHRLYCAEHLGVVRPFEKVSPSPGAHCPKDRTVVLKHRDHQDAHVGAVLHDPARRLDTAHPRHLDVHQNHVRLEIGGQGDGFLSGTCLPDKLRIGGRGQQRAQPVAEEGVVVGYEDAERVRVCSYGVVVHGCSFDQLSLIPLDELSPCAAYSPSGSLLSKDRRGSTRGPPRGARAVTHVPPSSAARSRIEFRPTPGWWPAGSPTPSSEISSSNSSSIVRR